MSIIKTLDVSSHVLSLEEIQHLTSKCGEFRSEKFDENGTIAIYYNNGTDEELRKLIYKPTMQTFLRDIFGLGWRDGNRNE